ncbi:hypothetical protein [Pelagovum pacificum]|uniref:Uncharacterized protein n=1 Tax=Pelagovum pacificum TaxID=2588711 RepID=A0A5C5G7Q6_9RHOB|nr:hypothetical protein [Pelagovum pacificum]TNY30739.1 hypothetical protein FHY64_19385 [Pelagovum pacificum]
MIARSRLCRLYLRSVAIGFAAAAVFVALLLGFDVGRLGQLVARDPAGMLAVLMLWIFNGIVFSGVQFGIAVMAVAERPDGSGGPGHRAFSATPVPVTVEARTRSPRPVVER